MDRSRLNPQKFKKNGSLIDKIKRKFFSLIADKSYLVALVFILIVWLSDYIQVDSVPLFSWIISKVCKTEHCKSVLGSSTDKICGVALIWLTYFFSKLRQSLFLYVFCSICLSVLVLILPTLHFPVYAGLILFSLVGIETNKEQEKLNLIFLSLVSVVLYLTLATLKPSSDSSLAIKWLFNTVGYNLTVNNDLWHIKYAAPSVNNS